ncbi:DUF58 domain-containing protein [Luteolibacter algae]|uniref:DUF58 domain-containing protein n=1 Tax=Luteolibacter algae TaxID=454151 RepID=A0ABW5D4R6_9BACT
MLEDLDKNLSFLELKCRRPVEHLLAGEYRSVFRGRGVEFEDVRPYQPGDDVRTMDWKVTARTGVAHIKRHIEEREQFVYLLVDLSGSILHGADGKTRRTVVEVCSLITMAAIKNQDRVGLVLFTDRVEMIIPPGKGRSHAMRIMDALLNFQPQGKGTGFAEMFTTFGHLARKHSATFVVSDFLSSDFLQEMQALTLRHDMNAIRIESSSVTKTKISGLVRMKDAESGRQRVVDLKSGDGDDGSVLRQQMVEAGVNLMELAVGQDCVESLAGFFHARQRMVTR